MADQKAQLWTTEDVATFLKCDAKTVERWRGAGEGPAYIRMGRMIRYIPGTVYRWAQAEQAAGATS